MRRNLRGTLKGVWSHLSVKGSGSEWEEGGREEGGREGVREGVGEGVGGRE